MINKLNKYANNITSQHGEDGIISYILEHVSIPKVCIEFGAWDGKYMSNTHNLWHNLGWSGILIEADTIKYNELKSNYSTYDLKVFNHFLEPKGKASLDNLFIENNLPKEVGVLSIDIDSTDYYIFKYLEHIDPSVVIIEHNHTIPGYIDYVDPEGDIFLRSSAKAIERLGKEKGYKLICCTETNSILIKNEIFDDKFFPDMPVEFLFDYSHILSFISATQGPAANWIPLINGRPTRFQKLLTPILNRLMALIKGSNYKKPNLKIMEALSKSKITVL